MKSFIILYIILIIPLPIIKLTKKTAFTTVLPYLVFNYGKTNTIIDIWDEYNNSIIFSTKFSKYENFRVF